MASLANRATIDGDLHWWGIRGRMIMAGRIPAPTKMQDFRESTLGFLWSVVNKADSDVVAATTGMIAPFDRGRGERIDGTTAPGMLSTCVSVANLSLFFAVATGITHLPPLTKMVTTVASDIMRYWHKHNELGRKLMAASRFLPQLTDQQKDIVACVSPRNRKIHLPWLTTKRRKDAPDVQDHGVE